MSSIYEANSRAKILLNFFEQTLMQKKRKSTFLSGREIEVPHFSAAERSDADTNIKDSGGQTPLMRSSTNGHIACVRHLLGRNDTDVNLLDDQLQSALHKAIINGKRDVAKRLLQLPGIAVNASDASGRSAIHHAAVSCMGIAI